VFPGLNVVPGIGAFISELDHAYAVIHRDRLLYHGRQYAMLAISALLFAVSLASWLLNPVNRARGYQSVYLFGCVLLSAHYVYSVFSGESYWIFGLFKNVPLCVGPVILVSSYLARTGARRKELANNLLFIASLLGTFLWRDGFARVLPNHWRGKTHSTSQPQSIGWRPRVTRLISYNFHFAYDSS
jgi:hypothetical protein